MPGGEVHFPHPLVPYASAAMCELWSDKWVARAERRLWIVVMQHQYAAGVFDHVEDWDRKFRAYKMTQADVRLWVIQDIERVTKHDLKARVEAFNLVASQWYGDRIELIHWGLTSADIVDNMALLRMRDGMMLLGNHTGAEQVPWRGIKGPVGTQQDMVDLLGSPEAAMELDTQVAKAMGFATLLQCVGQMSHRSIDFQVAVDIFGEIRAEPWRAIARGYMRMIEEYCGSTWNEGDVMSSSVRRVALPGLFLAADADRQADRIW